MKNAILWICLLLVCANLTAQTNAHQMVERMGGGINLGNTLSAPVEGNWSPAATEQYFIDIAEAGFTNVRIPIRFDTYLEEVPPFNLEETYLDRIEEVVDWALGQGLVTIIDVHGDHWFWESYSDGDPNTPSEDTYNRFLSIWVHLSERFKGKSENLLFEVMNEPYFDMSFAEVSQVNKDAIAIIREQNPTRNVIITGGGANSFSALLNIDTSLLLDDDFLIPTFHYYRPYNFTSSAKVNQNDYEWGSMADKETVNDEFHQVAEWAKQYDVPIFLGEFGADNENGLDYHTGTAGQHGGPDRASRIAYHEHISLAARKRGFATAVWCSGPKSNKAINLRTDNISNAISGKWVTEILNVLFPDIVTSIREDEVNFQLFPNPVDDLIVLKGLCVERAEMYQLNGQLVQTHFDSDLQVIPVSDLKEGVYLIKLFSRGKYFVKRVIVKR